MCLHRCFFLRWEHASQNGREAEVSRWRSSQWTCHLKILRAYPQDRVHICKHNTFSTLNPAPHPQHGSPRMWATVSGIIAPPCFHNVWWNSDAISKSSGVCWVSCSSVYCLKQWQQLWRRVLGVRLFLSFGAFAPIVSLIQFELLTLSTTAVADFGTNYGFFSFNPLFLLHWQSKRSHSKVILEEQIALVWLGHCILQLFKGLLSFMALMSSCAYSLVNWENSYSYAVRCDLAPSLVE